MLKIGAVGQFLFLWHECERSNMHQGFYSTYFDKQISDI